MPRIALVTMPFASTRRPSLQLGLLKGLAERVGWEARTFHLNLDFAALIGRERYELLCQHRGMQLSDWVFSRAAFGDLAPDPDGLLVDELPASYVAEMVRLGVESPRQWLLRLRDALVPAYLTAAAQSVLSGAAEVVGFTSTFQQNTASMALAQLLKVRQPELCTLFGGANFDDVMGLEFVRSVACIDYAVIGEGDESFPEFLQQFGQKGHGRGIAGVAWRRADGQVEHVARSAPYNELDNSPVPDYAEYFERGHRLGFLDDGTGHQVDLPVEGARGCWWGQKHHCIFCGLNAGTMKFRAKSPDRFLDEVKTLSRRHRSFHIEAVDNIIDMSYFKTVLPEVEKLQTGWNIFFEVKSNLGPEQVAQLARAGVLRIQPGIESMSTPILSTMRKGVRAIQNVNLLRWCAHYGISVSWNFLWGFPDETLAHYQAQHALMSKLAHLQPPDGQGRLWMERFSPLFTQRELLGVTSVVPAASYRRVYPDFVNLERAAYFFDYEMVGALPETSFEPIVALLDGWRAAWRSERVPSLLSFSSPGHLRIEDRRSPSAEGAYVFDGELADIYMACFDRPTAIHSVADRLGLAHERVSEAISEFESRGLMMVEDRSALSLATPSRVRA